MRRLAWPAIAAALLSACVLADVSLDRRACPCVDGWTCRDDVCVPVDSSAAATVDGGAEDALAQDDACTKQTAFDPDNCGMCGRSCNGAACQNGMCVSTSWAQGVSFPAMLAVTPESLLFTSEEPVYPGGTVSYCDRGKCTSDAVFSYSIYQPLPLSMATTATEVIWGTGKGELTRELQKQLPDGGVGRDNVDATSSGVGAIAVDDTRLFVAELGTGGAIRMCDARDLTTCANRSGTLIAAAQSNARSLVVEPVTKRLFWIADDNGGAILSCSTHDPCVQPTIVASGQPNAHALALDAARVFWTDAKASGAVFSAPLDGLAPNEAPQVLAHDLALPWGIAADGDYVYVTTLGASAVADAGAPDGTIVRVPREGGAPFVLAKALSRPWSIVVDGPSLFWTNRGTAKGGGSIASVAK